jgi:hypothetical protein
MASAALNSKLPFFSETYQRIAGSVEKDLLRMTEVSENLAKSLMTDGEGCVEDSRAREELVGGVTELHKLIKEGLSQSHTFMLSRDAIRQLAVGDVQAADYTIAFNSALKAAVAANPPQNAYKTDKSKAGREAPPLLLHSAPLSPHSPLAAVLQRMLARLEEAVALAGGEAVEKDVEAVDGDDDPVQLRARLLCPITKDIFRDPVRSSVCGHAFSRAAVTSMMKPNPHGGEGEEVAG